MEAHAKNHTLLEVPRGWTENIDPSTEEVFYTNSHTGAKVCLTFVFLLVSLTGFLVTMEPILQLSITTRTFCQDELITKGIPVLVDFSYP